MMNVHTIVVGAFAVNCHIVANANGQAMVIDPGDDAERIADCLRQRRLKTVAYLITHGHMDHISALAELAGIFPAPVAIHPKDAAWAFTAANAMPPYYEAPARPASIEHALTDNEIWGQLGTECRIITTPGHSPGGVCFHFPEAGILFTGDTLFAGSVGRTDLPGGDDAVLSRSLHRLTTLPGNTVIFPGHGPKSTIAQERRTNPFLAPHA